MTNYRNVYYEPCKINYPDRLQEILEEGISPSDVFDVLVNDEELFMPVRDEDVDSYEMLMASINDMHECRQYGYTSIMLRIDETMYFSPDYDSWFKIDGKTWERTPFDLSQLWNSTVNQMDEIERKIADLEQLLADKKAEYRNLKEKL